MMYRHVHAIFVCVVPSTGERHVVEKLQPAEIVTIINNGKSYTVFNGPSFYYCSGFNVVSPLKGTRGEIIGFQMYRSSDEMESPVKASVIAGIEHTESAPQRPGYSQSQVDALRAQITSGEPR